MIITKAIREEMTHALITHAFKKQIEDLIDEEQTLLEHLFNNFYSDKELKAIEMLKKRFPNSFMSIIGFNVNIDGQSMTVGETSKANRGELRKYAKVSDRASMVILDDYGRYRTHAEFAADDEVAMKILAHADKQSSINQSIKIRHAEIRALLDDIKTDRQMREKWPEAVPLVEHLMKPAQSVNLPALRYDEMNRVLGLPPETSD